MSNPDLDPEPREPRWKDGASGIADPEPHSHRRESPKSVEEALARARADARAAASSAIRALRSLLDAASLAWNELPADESEALRNIAEMLERIAADLDDRDALWLQSLQDEFTRILDPDSTNWTEQFDAERGAEFLADLLQELRDAVVRILEEAPSDHPQGESAGGVKDEPSAEPHASSPRSMPGEEPAC